MSMACPKCFEKAFCTDTRKRDGYTYRRYKCKCQNTFASAEVLVEGSRSGIPVLQTIQEQFKRIAQGKLRSELNNILGNKP